MPYTLSSSSYAGVSDVRADCFTTVLTLSPFRSVKYKSRVPLKEYRFRTYKRYALRPENVITTRQAVVLEAH